MPLVAQAKPLKASFALFAFNGVLSTCQGVVDSGETLSTAKAAELSQAAIAAIATNRGTAAVIEVSK
jgi:hypothetical protein